MSVALSSFICLPSFVGESIITIGRGSCLSRLGYVSNIFILKIALGKVRHFGKVRGEVYRLTNGREKLKSVDKSLQIYSNLYNVSSRIRKREFQRKEHFMAKHSNKTHETETDHVAEHEAIDNIAQMAEASVSTTFAEAPTEAPDEPAVEPAAESAAETSEPHGVRARRALMLKQLLPDHDWINKNIVAHGKGTRGLVGRIYGMATSASRKTNTLPDGSLAESISVSGVFSAESYLTGEISEASNVYFPMAYAEKLEALFISQPDIKVIEVDTDIGLEATGKTIPYEWIIIAYREGEEMAALKRLKNSRKRPDQLLRLTSEVK